MGRPSKKEKSAFVRNFIARRKALGWTQATLATKARMKQPTLRDIEAGNSPGLEENRQAIAAALGATMAELYEEPARQSTSPAGDLLTELTFPLAVQVLNAISTCSLPRRSIALYLLTKDELCLEKMKRDPALSQLVPMLKLIP